MSDLGPTDASGQRRRRRPYALGAGIVLLLASLVTALPARAATPSSSDVGVSGSGFPSSATWTGSSIVGNPDPLGPPAPACTNPGCDRTSFTLHAPAGFTTGNVISLTASATFAAGSTGGTADIAILDSSNAVLAQTTGAASPATVTASDLQPGNYVVEVDGDIGDPADTSYAGSLLVSSASRVAQPAHGDGGISASRETVADPFRLGTEPTIAVSPDGTTYESPIFGFSTTQSFVERSDNGGQTFNTLGVPGVGKTNACPGGGDSDLSTDPHNNLYFIDLGGAPVVPASVTADKGNNFTSNCIANDTDTSKPNNFPDRQWLSTDTVHNVEWYIYRDGLVNTTTPTDPVAGPTYGEFIKSAPLAAGAAGAAQLLFTNLCKNTAGLGVPCITDVAIAGNAVTDNRGPAKGNTYLAMTGHGGIGVAVINPSSATPVVERTAAPGAGAVLFPTVAVDGGGTVYETWVDSSNFQVMVTRSTDQGASWATPVAVNGAPAAVNVMPWIVAGDAGRVDIVFYGSPNHQPPTTNSGPWNVYMLQDLNAASDISFGAWTQAQMSDRANHVEPVCLSGLGCTTNTGPGGDRELGDFFRVALDGSGRAVVSFADGNNRLGTEVAGGPQAAPSFAGFLRQATGASLLSGVGTVPAIDIPTNSVSVGAHGDPIPFVSPAGPGPSVDALNLLSSSTASDASGVHVHLVVKNVDATAAVTAPALANSTFLTRWWSNGQIYFAAAEDNGGTFRFFSGQAAPVSDGLAIKYAYYPASGTATGTVTPGANGTIDINVPASQVGNPASTDTLFSVTSYTLTHAAPTPPTPPTASNFTDFPQIVDVLPAYNTLAANTVLPEAPAAPLLLALGGIGMLSVHLVTRRRRRALPASAWRR